MSLNDFISKYQGQSVLFPPNLEYLRGQCVQLVMFYLSEVLGITPPVYPIAADYFTNGVAGLDKVANSPDPANIPQPGDIVVWNTDLYGSGGAGHIGICVSAGPLGFTSFDSNWGGKTAHQVTHNWDNVAGWLHPEGEIMISKEDEQVLSQIATGDNPGVDYNYQFTGTSKWDECLNFWLAQSQLPGLRQNVDSLTAANLKLADQLKNQPAPSDGFNSTDRATLNSIQALIAKIFRIS